MLDRAMKLESTRNEVCMNVSTSGGDVSTGWGATRYEFRMQVRRKSVWIATVLGSLIVLSGLKNPWNAPADQSISLTITNWAIVCNAFLPIVFGVLLADRLPRDRRLHMTELFDSVPASPGARLFGKYLGSAIASTMPILLVYTVGIAYVLERWHDPMTIPLAIAAFVAVNVPGLLFVAAFSIAVPAIMWVPLYQFLYVGYWFWGNLLSPRYGIPTLSDSILTPIGSKAGAGFFGGETITNSTVPAWQGALSIVVLLTCAAITLVAANTYLGWRRGRA
jgi:ABC-2 type transport system permease protein